MDPRNDRIIVKKDDVLPSFSAPSDSNGTTDSDRTNNILSVVLSASGVALLLMCFNANNELRKCRENDNDDDDDDNYIENDGKDKYELYDNKDICTLIKSAISKRNVRYRLFLNMPFPKNYNMTYKELKLLFNNFILNSTQRTSSYNIEALRFVVDQFTSDYQSTVTVPSLLAYCMVYTKFKRDKTVEQMLLDKINAPNNDPFNAKNTLLDTYRHLTYRLIMLNYQKYNNISLYQPTADTLKRMNDTLDKSLTYKSFPTDPKTTTLDDGFYYDSNSGEIGYVKNRDANGLYELPKYVETFYFLVLSDRLVNGSDRTLVTDVFARSFQRIRFAVRKNYIQTRGNNVHVVMQNQNVLLDSMMKLYRLYPSRYVLSSEQWYEIKKLSKLPETNFDYICETENDADSLTSLNLANEWFKEAVVTSRSEGFCYYTNDWFVFEQCCVSPYLAFNDGDQEYDELRTNTWILKGYLNYGCDYTQLYFTFNNLRLTNILLPGQVILSTKVQGIVASSMIVKLEDNLYYVSMHNHDVFHVGGVIDGKTHTHRVYINSMDEYVFCMFGWVSDQKIVIVNDNTWLILYAHDVRFMLKCVNSSDKSNVPIKQFSTQLLNNNYYYFFTFDITKGSKLEYTIMMFKDVDDKDVKTLEIDNTKRINNYEIVKDVDSDIILNPTSSSCTMIKNTVKNERIVVDENVTLNSDNPIEAKVNSKTYKFSNNSMGRYVSIPNS